MVNDIVRRKSAGMFNLNENELFLYCIIVYILHCFWQVHESTWHELVVPKLSYIYSC